MSTTQQLRETGEAMGLKGSELTNFVKEQQTREENYLEREEKHLEHLERIKRLEIEQKEKRRLFEIEQRVKEDE